MKYFDSFNSDNFVKVEFWVVVNTRPIDMDISAGGCYYYLWRKRIIFASHIITFWKRMSKYEEITATEKAQGSPISTLFCPCVWYVICRHRDVVRYHLRITSPWYLVTFVRVSSYYCINIFNLIVKRKEYNLVHMQLLSCHICSQILFRILWLTIAVNLSYLQKKIIQFHSLLSRGITNFQY